MLLAIQAKGGWLDRDSPCIPDPRWKAATGSSVPVFSAHPASHLVQGIKGAVRQAARAREQPLIAAVLLDNTGRGLPPRLTVLRALSAHRIDRRTVQALIPACILLRAVHQVLIT